MLKSIGRTKLRDVVAKQLKQYILNANLKPGDRLPNEAELASIFGVNRISLREATKSLEYFGIIEAKPGRGLTVGSINVENIADCLGFHPALQSAPPLQLVNTRLFLENGTFPYVVKAMREDPGIYDRLNEINGRLSDAKEIQEFISIDLEFHRELTRASGLSPLVPFADILAVFFQRFRESVARSEWANGVAQHQAIIDSLRVGDIPAAVEVMHLHIEGHLHRMKTAPLPGEAEAGSLTGESEGESR
ncbi:FadR/GntR family transcriptional regulator [Planctomicrobium sp. SH661]|uniref:FadR/GntR family transcriptional regulator n=1 Tax=Planctomicrobium sp. SH661 TaxID=3448124 RepID=UPI003F5AF97F